MNAIVGKYGFEPAPMPNIGFRIEPHDRVTIEGMEYRYPGKSGAFVSLPRTDAQGLVDKYEIGNLARLSAAGKIRHEVEYYLPDDLKTMPAFKSADFQLSHLNPRQKQRFHICHAQMQALDEMVAEGILRPTTREIELCWSELEARTARYLAQVRTSSTRVVLFATGLACGLAKPHEKLLWISVWISVALRRLHGPPRFSRLCLPLRLACIGGGGLLVGPEIGPAGLDRSCGSKAGGLWKQNSEISF